MSATITRWSRRYVLVSVVAFVCWQVGVLLDVPRGTEIALGVYGFVLHMVFGKAYALVPSHFERELALLQAPKIQFPLVTGGTAGLVAASLGLGPAWLPTGSAILWFLGVTVFVGTLLRTIGRPLLAGETGTGTHNAERRATDRFANGFVPVALAYLLAGSYETLALYGPVPPLFDGVPAQASHLLAAGTAALLVFAIGFRILPRFLGVRPSLWAVRTVLIAAATGPALIAVGISDGRLLQFGAVLEATAVGLFAVTFAGMFLRSDRRRIGLYGVAVGAGFGIAGVSLGLLFAFYGITGSLTTLHLRLNVLGFVGLVIVGLAYQFYPPSVGSLPGSSDRTAGLSILGIGLGLAFHVAAAVGGSTLATTGGVLTLLGSLGYAYLIGSAFLARA